MKVTKVETTPVVLPLPQPINSALEEIRCFGCVLVHLHTDEGIVGENLVFTLNNIRTAVLREMVDGLAPLIVGCDPEHITVFWSKAWTEMNFTGHEGASVVGISAIDHNMIPTEN